MTRIAPLLVFGVWLATHRDAMAWLSAQYVRWDRRVELVLLAAVVTLAWRRLGGPLPALRRLAHAPAYARAPLFLFGTCLAVDLLAAPLGLHIVHATLFLIGGYALAGLWAPAAAWRAGLPWVGLLTATLPFGPMIDVYIGFPARLLTAEAVRHILDVSGVASLSRDTVLLLDRPEGIAAIDVAAPCAGVRSLWAAGVFLLGAAAAEGRRLDGWFGLASLTTLVGVLAANLLRVTTLVVVTAVFETPRLAGLLHVPLGLAGFGAAVYLGWLVLQLGALSRTGTPAVAPPAPPETSRPALHAWLAPGLAALVLIAALLRPASPPAQPDLALTYTPGDIGAVAIEPVPAERAFFADMGVAQPQKWRFTTDTLSGTLLLLPSRAWRAHHRPEACLLGQGLSVEGPWSVWLAPDFPAQMAKVAGGAATGLWWFQSPTGMTDDYTARTWAAVSGRETRWVLVSALVDGDHAAAALAPFADHLRVQLAGALAELALSPAPDGT